jgi:hypothetical protein
MQLTPHQKKQLRLGLFFLLVIPLTILFVYKSFQYIWVIGLDSTPKDVIVSNVSTNSLTISWVTEKPVEAFVIPIFDDVEGTQVCDKRGKGKRNIHYVELNSLEPSTEYSFILLSDEERYTGSQGVSYKFSTASIEMETLIRDSVFGSIPKNYSEDMVVYILLSNKSVYPLSSVVSSSGDWIVDLSILRDINDKSLTKITSETQITVLIVKSFVDSYVFQGDFSSMFDVDGNFVFPLTLKEGEPTKKLLYFPSESLMGGKRLLVIRNNFRSFLIKRRIA